MLSWRVCVLLVGLVVLAGCRGGTGAGSESSQLPELSEAGEVNGEDVGPHGRLNLSRWVHHHHRPPFGMAGSFFLRGVEVDDWGNLFLEVEGVARTTVEFAEGGISLVDDRGNQYEWVPPESNPKLRLDEDLRMRARLGFEGPVDEQAQRFDVRFEGNEVLTYVIRAQFEGVPLPGVGLEEEAIGPAVGAQDSGSWDVDLSVESPDDSRVLMTVHSAEFRDGSTVVHLTVENNRPERTELRGVSLTDPGGERFWFQSGDGEGFRPHGGFLEVEGHHELDATLVWLGVPSLESEVLRLRFNMGRGPHGLDHPEYPSLELEIPIP